MIGAGQSDFVKLRIEMIELLSLMNIQSCPLVQVAQHQIISILGIGAGQD